MRYEKGVVTKHHFPEEETIVEIYSVIHLPQYFIV